MLVVVLLVMAYVLFLMAKAFRSTLSTVENPTFVMEQPPMPKDLAAVMKRADKWKEEGRVSREEYEKIVHLVMEDNGR